MNIIMIIPKNT